MFSSSSSLLPVSHLKPPPGRWLESMPMTPPAAQPCANTGGHDSTPAAAAHGWQSPAFTPLRESVCLAVKTRRGIYVHLINLKTECAALMEVAEQPNRIEPSASAKSQNN